ncbi:MAG TPA: helix-turn-helix domain-containing protein [Pyrinomonadaceae bacterium]|nr:helix-turn-helix domain-containing protein [Pyrinomonadaceae bacterium]HMP65959.1 helix-turn-helix domain-containing protein [Pyrinomonadaceae bacterium]
MRDLMDNLIDEMLDGHILLSEAISEFEKLYIEKALARNGKHLSHTADALGIHRNTLSKRVADYKAAAKPRKAPNANKPAKMKPASAKKKKAVAARRR